MFTINNESTEKQKGEEKNSNHLYKPKFQVLFGLVALDRIVFLKKVMKEIKRRASSSFFID